MNREGKGKKAKKSRILVQLENKIADVIEDYISDHAIKAVLSYMVQQLMEFP